MSDFSSQSVLITRKEIQEYGLKARSRYPSITQNCGRIVDDFEGLLIDECGLPYRGEVVEKYGREQIRVGPEGEEKHYVFVINGGLVEGFSSSQEVWIDLSFDQFNVSNKEKGIVDVSYGLKSELESIRIIPPSDERRSQYKSIGELL